MSAAATAGVGRVARECGRRGEGVWAAASECEGGGEGVCGCDLRAGGVARGDGMFVFFGANRARARAVLELNPPRVCANGGREECLPRAGGRRPMTRIQTPYLDEEDALEEEQERSLRPRRLEEFVGQRVLREQLAVAIEAAAARGDALDHLLLAGPPGLGKTSLAQIVAVELGVPFVQTAGPALERKGDIAAFLTALEPRSIFFLDEIHRLPRALEETFYPAMEDHRLPITVGQGAGARVVTLDLPPFTLVGATTRSGLLTTPLRDRFGIQARLEHYSTAELAAIVTRSARILGIELQDGGAQAIAARSRGTPRVANRLLKRVRDYAEVRMDGVLSAATADAALELLEVDALGLDRLDREILRAICAKFDGGPVGLSTLAIAVGEEPDTLEDVYEPHLLREGLIKRTPRGRAATAAAFAHLGLEPPAASTEAQSGLAPGLF